MKDSIQKISMDCEKFQVARLATFYLQVEVNASVDQTESLLMYGTLGTVLA